MSDAVFYATLETYPYLVCPDSQGIQTNTQSFCHLFAKPDPYATLFAVVLTNQNTSFDRQVTETPVETTLPRIFVTLILMSYDSVALNFIFNLPHLFLPLPCLLTHKRSHGVDVGKSVGNLLTFIKLAHHAVQRFVYVAIRVADFVPLEVS